MIFERPQKHSLTLNGHRTSVTLEPAFWAAFCKLAKNKSLTINAFAADIDAKRGLDCGLASAIRLTVLQDLQDNQQAD